MAVGTKPAPRPTRPRNVPRAPASPWAVAGAVLVPVAAVFILTSSSDFVLDDLINLRRAQFEGLSLDYLLSSTSGHFAPGHLLGDWLLQEYFPFDFTVARLALAAGFALSLLLLYRILVTLFRAGSGALVITLLYGASVVHVSALQWWASGLDRVPADVFAFTSILLYLHYFRRKAPAALVGSLVALALALMFYVKPIFIPLYLVLIRILFLEPDRRLRDTVRSAAREWPVWAAYGAAVATFSAIYIHYYPDNAPDRSLGTLAEYLGTLWFRVVGPNLVGLYVPQGGAQWIGSFQAVVAQGLIAILVVGSLARRRPAWRAWAFFLAAAVPNAMIVGVSRVDYFGPAAVAYANFFNREIFLLFFIAVAAAFFPARERVPIANEDPPPPASPRARRWVVVGLSAYVASSWAIGWHVSRPELWVGARAHAYFERAESALAFAFRDSDNVGLVDGVVPDDVVIALGAPYNNQSEVFPLFNEKVSFDATRPILLRMNEAEELLPVSFRSLTGGDVIDLVRRGDLGLAGGAVAPTQGGLCLRSGDDDAIIGFRPPTPIDGESYLRLTYLTRTPTTLGFVTKPTPTVDGPRFTYVKARRVRLPAEGFTTRVIAIDAPRVEELVLNVSPNSQICLRDFAIGHLVEGYSSPGS